LNIFAFLFGFPAPILFALLLNELWNHRFKKITQTITYMPHFVSWIIISGIFYRLLDEYSGSVNELLELIGIGRIPFMRKPSYFQPMMIVLTIWKEVGWYSIIYLAALSAIDQELYDAADVDGANRLQQIFHITLPSISTTVSVMLILTVGRIATGGGIIPNFDAVFPMLNPFLYQTGEILQVHTYIEGLTYNRLSYATAVGITQSFVALLLVVFSNAIIRKTRGYGVY
jgi:putative aldouronate transport system permease protein